MSFNSLSDLRKSRDNFDSLLKQVESISNTRKSTDDDRFWKPTVDKAGNGQAIIRFLPPPKGEKLPWVRLWDHGFQGPSGKWYIENSLTTLNRPDPVAELNSELWNSGIEANKEIARKQKRRLYYYSNILVVKDPGNPDNEGKVFVFKYGKKIFDKIKDVMMPQFEDDPKVNPFDFWKGANFRLKIRQVEGYRNYDKSDFEPESVVAQSDEAIESIWNKQYSLEEIVDPKNFKSYEELKAKLNMVLGGGTKVPTAERVSAPNADVEDEMFISSKTRAAASTSPAKTDDDDDVDNMSYFASLADDE